MISTSFLTESAKMDIEWNATKRKSLPSSSVFLLCHTPAHIPRVCVSPCMQLLRHVVHNSLFSSYTASGSTQWPRCGMALPAMLGHHNANNSTRFFFLRSEGNEMVIACFLRLYLASQCQDCLSPAFLYFPPCCIIRGGVTLWQLVFYCMLHTCSTDISNLWKRRSLHL